MIATKSKTETKDANVRDVGVWLFRVFVLVAAGMMLVSWLLPWWTVDIESFGNNMVQIRPWGLRTK